MVLWRYGNDFTLVTEAIALVFRKFELWSCCKHTTIPKYVDETNDYFLILYAIKIIQFSKDLKSIIWMNYQIYNLPCSYKYLSSSLG
jgi:hypothetical protein